MGEIMKRLGLWLGAFLFFCSPAFAVFPQLVAYTTGTQVTVWVTTTPAPLISTGTNVNEYGVPFQVNFGTTAPTTSQGQILSERLFMEIVNDSTQDIYIGYNANVSSTTGVYRGRRIPANGGTWAHDCSIRGHWAVAGSSTGYLVTVTQEK